MSKYDDSIRYKALNMLQNDESFSVVSSKLDVPITTIIRWNKEFEEAKLNGGIETILDLDKVVLGEVLDNLPAELSKSSDKLAASISSADKLREDLHTTASHINHKVKGLTLICDNVSELLLLTEVLCSLQNAFFNSKSMSVNIQNNNGTAGYSEFLSDKPNIV